MSHFVHLRHQPPLVLDRPRELILAMPPLQSGVNLSRVVRAAGCWGIQRILVEGPIRLDKKIARDGAETVQLESRRSRLPVLKKLKSDGYEMVGLEQTTGSESLFDFQFVRRTVLVVGHERDGLSEECLAVLDRVAEIPVFGMPYSHNVATATCMAMYEYCRQFPRG